MDRNSAKIDDTAATWLRQRESDGWTSARENELETWLDECTAHRVAFLRLEAAWEETGRLHALAPGYRRLIVPGREQLTLELTPKQGAAALPSDTPEVTGIQIQKQSTASSPFFRPRAVIAASIATAAIGLVVLYLPSTGDVYGTPVGGLTSVPLKDGSSIALNTATEVRVRLTDTERRVELTQGEVYFEVAKDPRRPFTVTAADKVITAVGTAFSVRREGGDVRVVVTEGKVKVEFKSMPSRAATFVTPGGIVRTEKQTVSLEQKAPPQAEELLSWREGYVVFRNTPLPDVVAEFNRYNDRKMEIADPAVAVIRLTGKFRATNTEALIRLLEKSFEVSARQAADRIVLAQRNGATPSTE